MRTLYLVHTPLELDQPHRMLLDRVLNAQPVEIVGQPGVYLRIDDPQVITRQIGNWTHAIEKEAVQDGRLLKALDIWKSVFTSINDSYVVLLIRVLRNFVIHNNVPVCYVTGTCSEFDYSTPDQWFQTFQAWKITPTNLYYTSGRSFDPNAPSQASFDSNFDNL